VDYSTRSVGKRSCLGMAVVFLLGVGVMVASLGNWCDGFLVALLRGRA
jgi:hypothetical protein